MADTSLFGRLKTLFASDIIVRNVGGDELKIADVNQIQSTGRYQTNSLVDRFSRLYIYNNKNVFNPNLNYQTLRIQLYSDYEAMDTDPIIASALDIVADEATVKNDNNDRIKFMKRCKFSVWIPPFFCKFIKLVNFLFICRIFSLHIFNC